MQRLGRLALPFAAQAMLSLGQMGITIVGTVRLTPDGWGRFAVLLSVFFVAAGFVRGFGALPVVIYLSGDPERSRAARRAAVLLTLAAAVPASITIAVVGLGLATAASGLALAVALVTYALYDTTRSVEMSAVRYGRVVSTDAVVMVVLAGFCAIGLLPGVDASVALPVAMTIAYGAGAAGLALRGRPTRSWSVRVFLDEYRRDIPFLALDGVLIGTTMSAVVIALGASTSLAVAGAFRSCTTLIAGPFQMLQTGLSPTVIRSMRGRAVEERSADHRNPTQAAPSSFRARMRSLAFPATIAASAIVAAVLWGTTAAAVVPFVLSAVHVTALSDAVPFSVVGCLLVSALWTSTVFSTFQRYRRSNAELTTVRVITLACSLGILIAVPSDIAVPVRLIAATTPWVVVPALHAALRWAPVSRRL
ncbi:hypothetical protein DEJ30_01525 [Curtobacterium sp. MCPF17_003]|uniref:hypothetical protein n=1 Tax=Curtobacterium sp. MCPF17_003 TaxID=2175637 RepID=UPI000DA03867|nr:hypothetical protein [Curtobacterium sp. MCPF17_003]PYY65769.1 hypothetical protein DEJ30_01525 [Curtobacterium sp. MCPF17_003]